MAREGIVQFLRFWQSREKKRGGNRSKPEQVHRFQRERGRTSVSKCKSKLGGEKLQFPKPMWGRGGGRNPHYRPATRRDVAIRSPRETRGDGDTNRRPLKRWGRGGGEERRSGGVSISPSGGWGERRRDRKKKKQIWAGLLKLWEEKGRNGRQIPSVRI